MRRLRSSLGRSSLATVLDRRAVAESHAPFSPTHRTASTLPRVARLRPRGAQACPRPVGWRALASGLPRGPRADTARGMSIRGRRNDDREAQSVGEGCGGCGAAGWTERGEAVDDGAAGKHWRERGTSDRSAQPPHRVERLGAFKWFAIPVEDSIASGAFELFAAVVTAAVRDYPRTDNEDRVPASLRETCPRWIFAVATFTDT